MATDPNTPPPEPVPPISTPPEPGEVQTTPMPMAQDPQPRLAEDENQAGFLGERNLPHP